MTNLIFVANWKMELSYQQALAIIAENIVELRELDLHIRNNNKLLVLCPSFDALASIKVTLKKANLTISLGAQDCSPHNLGPYTGQVSAASLSQIGVTHCIVGHSERRIYQHETSKQVFAKTKQLLKNGITPIICIGETAEEKASRKTFIVLEEQINMCAHIYHELCSKHYDQKDKNQFPGLYVAYEPVWAIGSGKIPTNQELEDILAWLNEKLPYVPLLYGGSVTEHTIEEIAALSKIKGFIIGYASCNIQRLKNMVFLT